jgi:hypothetical protein
VVSATVLLVAAGVAIVVIIWLVWRYSSKLERDIEEERQMREYIQQLSFSDPALASQWMMMYNQKFR